MRTEQKTHRTGGCVVLLGRDTQVDWREGSPQVGENAALRITWSPASPPASGLRGIGDSGRSSGTWWSCPLSIQVVYTRVCPPGGAAGAL